MKLNYITIVVRNLEKSIKFYTELAELKIIRKAYPPAGEIVFLANEEGETMLELVNFKHVPSVTTRSLTISFATSNLDEIHQKAIDLNYHPTDIIDRPPKPIHFQVMDPDEINVEFSDQ